MLESIEEALSELRSHLPSDLDVLPLSAPEIPVPSMMIVRARKALFLACETRVALADPSSNQWYAADGTVEPEAMRQRLAAFLTKASPLQRDWRISTWMVHGMGNECGDDVIFGEIETIASILMRRIDDAPDLHKDFALPGLHAASIEAPVRSMATRTIGRLGPKRIFALNSTSRRV